MEKKNLSIKFWNSVLLYIFPFVYFVTKILEFIRSSVFTS